MKQVLIMRSDLGMSPGKLASQAAHAAVKAVANAPLKWVDEWNRSGCTKIVLEVRSDADLISLYKLAVRNYLPVALIADEGRTEVSPGSITALGIGPAPKGDIDKITGDLKLYGKEN
jgi:peptidyl-tRNA hydrolase, PTH2 family